MINVQISKEYAYKVKNMLEDGGVWFSSVNELPLVEAIAIVSEYRKIFNKVDFDIRRGIVICTK